MIHSLCSHTIEQTSPPDKLECNSTRLCRVAYHSTLRLFRLYGMLSYFGMQKRVMGHPKRSRAVADKSRAMPLTVRLTQTSIYFTVPQRDFTVPHAEQKARFTSKANAPDPLFLQLLQLHLYRTQTFNTGLSLA